MLKTPVGWWWLGEFKGTLDPWLDTFLLSLAINAKMQKCTSVYYPLVNVYITMENHHFHRFKYQIKSTMSMVHFPSFSIANCNNYQRVTSKSHDHHPWAQVQDLALLFQVRCKDKGGRWRLKLARQHQMGIKWLDEYGGVRINDDFYILVHMYIYIHITNNMMYGRSILNRFSDLRCLSKSLRKHGTNWWQTFQSQGTLQNYCCH